MNDMTLNQATPLSNRDDILSRGVAAAFFLIPIWGVQALLLIWAQEAWYDPWDMVQAPAADTLPAMLRTVINGPLFFVFGLFVLGGSLLMIGRGAWKATEHSYLLFRIALAQLTGAALFAVLIISSRFIANLWATIPSDTYWQYFNYNHYIRTGPFIVLGFLFFGLFFRHNWRME